MPVVVRHEAALLLVDVFSDYRFDGGQKLKVSLQAIAANLLSLKAMARRHGLPVLYVNDNFGLWQSDVSEVIQHCFKGAGPDMDQLRRLLPEKPDYFIIKPMHSAFYGTPLEIILNRLGVRKLILAGATGNICVLFTANDAHMRGYTLMIPGDCVASASQHENRAALDLMRQSLKACIQPHEQLRWLQGPERAPENGS